MFGFKWRPLTWQPRWDEAAWQSNDESHIFTAQSFRDDFWADFWTQFLNRYSLPVPASNETPDEAPSSVEPSISEPEIPEPPAPEPVTPPEPTQASTVTIPEPEPEPEAASAPEPEPQPAPESEPAPAPQPPAPTAPEASAPPSPEPAPEPAPAPEAIEETPPPTPPAQAVAPEPEPEPQPAPEPPAPAPTPAAAPAPQPEPEPTPPSAPTFSPEDFSGAGHAVVIIDSGYSLDYDQSNLIYAQDFVTGGSGSARVGTHLSHGSWVAEVITDTAQDTDIIHLRVLPEDGGNARITDIEAALQWVIDHGAEYNVAAVNLSLGYGFATTGQTSVLTNEFDALSGLGIFSVVAAGNSGWDSAEGVNVFAAEESVIGVSAIGAGGGFTAFSQKDAQFTDIAAWGEGITMETESGVTFAVSGTSFAAAAVSGAAALLQDAADDLLGRSLTESEFLTILRESGDAVTGYGASGPDGYVAADGDAALEWFLEHADDFGDSFWIG